MQERSGDARDVDIAPQRGDRLTDHVISCIIQVHQVLGPGVLENVYRRALIIELRKHGLETEAEKEVISYYEGERVGRHRLDILVEQRLILELKTSKL